MSNFRKRVTEVVKARKGGILPILIPITEADRDEAMAECKGVEEALRGWYLDEGSAGAAVVLPWHKVSLEGAGDAPTLAVRRTDKSLEK